jgi:hypothetical protein
MRKTFSKGVSSRGDAHQSQPSDHLGTGDHIITVRASANPLNLDSNEVLNVLPRLSVKKKISSIR